MQQKQSRHAKPFAARACLFALLQICVLFSIVTKTQMNIVAQPTTRVWARKGLMFYNQKSGYYCSCSLKSYFNIQQQKTFSCFNHLNCKQSNNYQQNLANSYK
jgi:hypothetical protein